MKPERADWIIAYLESWWFPSVLFLLILASTTMYFAMGQVPSPSTTNVILGLNVISYSGIPASVLWNLASRRWPTFLFALSMVIVCAVASLFGLGFLSMASFFGQSRDGFAAGLTIPQGIEITSPEAEITAAPGADDDRYQSVLLDALQVPATEDASVTAQISSLIRLHRDAPGLLLRYLSVSPSWRVFEENGSRFATRRWMIGTDWRYDLHGYYSLHDIDTWRHLKIPEFQSRFTIGLSGIPWWKGNRDTTRIPTFGTRPVVLSEGNQMQQSHCVITSGNLVVEVFEQSVGVERRLTKAAIGYVMREMSALLDQPDEAGLRQQLPRGSIGSGPPTIELRNSFQPGIYDAYIWVNPGEAGRIYLKAFEVTEDTALSVRRLAERSNERIGWSDDDNELFFSNTHFTIYEGDWGDPYAARFEVWFAPDSGDEERMLLSRVFCIQGWQR